MIVLTKREKPIIGCAHCFHAILIRVPKFTTTVTEKRLNTEVEVTIQPKDNVDNTVLEKLIFDFTRTYLKRK